MRSIVGGVIRRQGTEDGSCLLPPAADWSDVEDRALLKTLTSTSCFGLQGAADLEEKKKWKNCAKPVRLTPKPDGGGYVQSGRISK